LKLASHKRSQPTDIETLDRTARPSDEDDVRRALREFSGHGFKCASAIGQVLAELAMDGHASLPIEFLGLKRFGISA
jgi:hypothetical protein